jgi:hypothetical protein
VRQVAGAAAPRRKAFCGWRAARAAPSRRAQAHPRCDAMLTWQDSRGGGVNCTAFGLLHTEILRSRPAPGLCGSAIRRRRRARRAREGMNYAGAPCTEVWSASGNETKLAAWENGRALRRVFDAEVRGFVAELPPGGGPPRPALQGAGALAPCLRLLAALACSSPGCRRPAGLTRPRVAVAVVHPVLVMQVSVAAAAVLSFELRRGAERLVRPQALVCADQRSPSRATA